jgi:thiol-disulfide isomerase/thioredoxin
MMKRLFIFSAIALLAITAQAQDITRIHLNDLRKLMHQDDAVYVINFWATWCHPCVEELPTIEKIADEYKDKNVKVLLVSMDYPNAYPQRIQAFAKKHHLDSKLYWLDEDNPNAIRATLDDNWQGVIPCTLIINNKTGYRKFIQGEIMGGELRRDVDKAL